MAIDYTRRGDSASKKQPEPTIESPEPAPASPGIDFSRRNRTAAPGTPSGPAATRPPAPPSPPAATPARPISLSKITLTKSAPTISLTKRGQSQGTMRVNLNWTSKAPGKGFLAKVTGNDSIDLDIGCLFELSDGSKGGIQALGNQFGNLQRAPYILLDGDDRSGASVGGENLLINLEQPGRFKRILIFAMIYRGATSWTEANGVVTLFPTAGPEVEVRLDGDGSDSRVCAIAMLENQGGDLVVRREVQYIQGNQQKLDEAYGWGMNWTRGSK